jgi:hypothetical protein
VNLDIVFDVLLDTGELSFQSKRIKSVWSDNQSEEIDGLVNCCDLFEKSAFFVAGMWHKAF